MITPLVLGCLFGAAVCLLIFALVPPRPSLGRMITSWERARQRHTLAATAAAAARTAATASAGSRTATLSAVSGVAREGSQRWRAQIGHWLVAQLAQRGIVFGKLRKDLELGEQSLEAHLVRKCLYGLVGLVLPSAMSAVMAAGGAHINPAFPVIGGLCLAAVLFWLPDVAVAQTAEQRRAQMREVLSCYLDWVSMSLAGGRGVPEALPVAARMGTGWGFTLLRTTIDRARLVGDTPWEALGDLGRRTGVRELEDLGGALTLVADDGAKVRASLTARAASGRRRQIAEDEGTAQRQDQYVQLAQLIPFVGFLLFLGYPAVAAVMAV